MRDLLGHELRSRVPAVLGWGIGLALFAALYLRMYPEIATQLGEGAAHFSIYRAIGVDPASFAGFVASTVVQFIPLMLGVYAIVNGTDALAGEEDRGVLELVVAMPLARWRIVTAKFIAMAAAVGAMLLLAAAGGALTYLFMDAVPGVTAGSVFRALLTPWPLVMAFVTISLLLGALLPSRRAAAMSATVVLLVSYFGERMAVLLDAPAPLHRLSLFHYFDTGAAVLRDGVTARDPLILSAVGLLCFGLTLLVFDRRDLTVGRWPWQ